MHDGGGYLPPDLEINPTVAAASAAAGSKDSYTKKINLPLVKNKEYKFFFTYFHEDPETKEIKESDKSPVWTESFTIPNLTKAVQNLTLTPGLKSYGVKFNIDPTSIQEDVVIFESLTGAFAGEEYIVYVGTSTNVTIQTSNYAPRWARVRSRDKWDDLNITNVSAGPVTPLNAEVDTTRVPTAPLNSTVSGSIDPDDLSGFSVKITASWTANTDADTNGYVIRWSSQDPSVVANPLWEYGQVDGKATTTFSITGLTPNTKYYWQVTSKSPFNTISWASPQSGTVGPVVDPNAPADVWSQLRSIISIGGKTADLFKIGTGISQSINTSNTITPSQTAGTYSGIILNRSTTNFGHNYWLNTGQFRVGSASAFLYWDGSDIYTTGKINATGGTFTGNLRVTTGSIISGGTFAPDGSVSGARVVMQPSGLFAHDATGAQSVVIQSSDGLIDARKGYIGGWTLDGTAQTTGSIQSSNTKIESNGTITLGDITGTLGSIVRLSATDPFRIWIGSQSSSNAPFKVSSSGVLTATGATITGNVQITSGSTYDSIVAAQAAATAASAAATAASAAAGTASTNASAALTTANGKNSIFRSASTPTALKEGDIWINWNDENKLYVSTAAGTGSWQLSRDSAISSAVTKADAAQATANAAVATANAAYPASNFSKSAILQAINASTNGTKLDGGILETGTVLADNVVSTYVYAGYISADKINAGILSGIEARIDTGRIGGFTLGGLVGDLTASTSPSTGVYPRIKFGNKILLGWDDATDNNYTFRIGNPYTTVTRRFAVNTITNVNRIKVDTDDADYAAEIRNIVRAVGFRHMGSGFVADSSRRFKENIVEMPKTFYERILNVPINFFTYKNDVQDIPEAMWGTHNFGPVVEDMEEAGLGLFVERNLDGLPSAFRNEQKYSLLLIPIVRDMKLKIEELESKILELESR
jgi:hypothetical protein